MKFFQIIPANTNINFIGKLPLFVSLSVVLLLVVVSGMVTKGFNFGIDFTGGSVAHIKFSEPRTAEAVRSMVAEIGEPDASVVAADKAQTEYLITIRSKKAETQAGTATLDKKLLEKAGPGKAQILAFDNVGPKVGEELKWAAVQSLIYSILLIMIYIWFRFDFRFAPGATVAMVHDLLMVAGFYLFTGKEFTITAVAALLTIAGYSVNDTIVIYDRVRELLKAGGDAIPLPQTINKAINITLSRTLLTSFVTLLSVLPIIYFCEGDIGDFAEAMAVGIFVGSYSTIYIAAPLTIYVEKFFSKKKNLPSRHRPATA